jgi:hypothetical protein
MDTLQFILRYTGKVTVNGEYTADIPRGSALEINWFPNNDLIIETPDGKFTFNESAAGRQYPISIERKENLTDLPVRFDKGGYLIAGDIVINTAAQEYFRADRIDILENEIVAVHGDKMTRIVFHGDSAAAEEYMKAGTQSQPNSV